MPIKPALAALGSLTLAWHPFDMSRVESVWERTQGDIKAGEQFREQERRPAHLMDVLTEALRQQWSQEQKAHFITAGVLSHLPIQTPTIVPVPVARHTCGFWHLDITYKSGCALSLFGNDCLCACCLSILTGANFCSESHGAIMIVSRKSCCSLVPMIAPASMVSL